MASNNQVDLESQEPTPTVVDATAPPPTTAAGGGGVVVSGRSQDDVAPETQPLLAEPQPSTNVDDDDDVAADATTRLESAITQAFQSTAQLAKHLPTGAVLAFEVLSPVFTNGGSCDDVGRTMTAWLVALCAAACFLLCFTDSFRDGKGAVRYVVATWGGVWVIDGTPPPASEEEAAAMRLRFIDFFHAVLSLVVFMSVAMFDKNVGACFNPVMSDDTKQVLTDVPLAGGLVGTLLFATFPSTRHGIGFPVPASS